MKVCAAAGMQDIRLCFMVRGRSLQALEEALAPRLRLAGDTGSLTKFGDFLSSRTLEKGTDIILLYRPEGVLEMAILPPGSLEYVQVNLSDPFQFTPPPLRHSKTQLEPINDVFIKGWHQHVRCV